MSVRPSPSTSASSNARRSLLCWSRKPHDHLGVRQAESGKGAAALDRRPQLAAALAAARAAKCPGLVSKLDRLSRDVAFVAGLPFVRSVSGARLGNPTNLTGAGERGRAVAQAAADEHARGLLPLLRSIRAEGAQSIGAITIALNERKIPTARGARWHVSSVMNLLERAQKLDALQ
jgi:hypothetical protein